MMLSIGYVKIKGRVILCRIRIFIHYDMQVLAFIRIGTHKLRFIRSLCFEFIGIPTDLKIKMTILITPEFYGGILEFIVRITYVEIVFGFTCAQIFYGVFLSFFLC